MDEIVALDWNCDPESTYVGFEPPFSPSEVGKNFFLDAPVPEREFSHLKLEYDKELTILQGGTDKIHDFTKSAWLMLCSENLKNTFLKYDKNIQFLEAPIIGFRQSYFILRPLAWLEVIDYEATEFSDTFDVLGYANRMRNIRLKPGSFENRSIFCPIADGLVPIKKVHCVFMKRSIIDEARAQGLTGFRGVSLTSGEWI